MEILFHRSSKLQFPFSPSRYLGSASKDMASSDGSAVFGVSFETELVISSVSSSNFPIIAATVGDVAKIETICCFTAVQCF